MTGFLTRHDNNQAFPVGGPSVTLDSFMDAAGQDNARRQAMIDSIVAKENLQDYDTLDNRREIYNNFVEIVGKMYSHHPYKNITAKISKDSPVVARVIMRPPELTLEVNPFFFALTKKQQLGILRHEAIHIQHHKHDIHFRRMAKWHDAPFKVADLFGVPYTVFVVQRGQPDKKIEDFDDYDSAVRFARAYMKENKIPKMAVHQVLPKNLKAKLALFAI